MPCWPQSFGTLRRRPGTRSRAGRYRAFTTRRPCFSPTDAWRLAVAAIRPASVFPNTGRRSIASVPVPRRAPDDHVGAVTDELRTIVLRRHAGRLDRHQGCLSPAADTYARIQLLLGIRAADVLADCRGTHCHRAAERQHRSSRDVHALRDQRQRRAIDRRLGEDRSLELSSSTARLDAPKEGAWTLALRSVATQAPTAPAPTAPAAVSPPTIFGSLRPGATSGESGAIGSYAKRIVCTLNRNRVAPRKEAGRGPP